MSCEFKDESQKCFQTKEKCQLEDFEKCKYYIRQKPKDEKLYKLRFKKVLEKALKKRDVYNKYQHLLNDDNLINLNIPIYDNVQQVLNKLEVPIIEIKVKRPLSDKDLEGNILKNITSNLYKVIPIKILQKFDETNSIIIAENGDKFSCKINAPLSKFFQGLKKAKKKDEYFRNYVINRVKIK